MSSFRPETRNRYSALLHRQGVLVHFGRMRLDEIDEMTVRAYATALIKRGLTIKGHINLVRTVMRCSVESGALANMPRWPAKLIKASRKLPDAPTASEVATMLATSSGWLRVAVALAALGGLRMGEVLALEVRDVELAERRVIVRHALSGGEVVTPKSGHERHVPMVPQLLDIVTEAIKGRFPKSRIVTTSTGSTPPRQAVLRMFKEHLTRVELRERSFHQLRHFFCSELVRHGVNVEAVRVLAGHSSLAVTARYLHASDADLREAVAKLAR
jgi:integrase